MNESEEKRNWRVGIIFCMARTQSEEEREWKERKTIKAKWHQIRP